MMNWKDVEGRSHGIF